MIKAFTYYGGKFYMVKNILPYLEIEHQNYIEVFGGSATILLNKKESKLEVYNDIYSEVVNFFRVIRNKAKLRKLQEFISDSVYSREEFNKFKNTLENTPVDWKRAAKFYYLQRVSFSGQGDNFSVKLNRNYAKLLRNRVLKLNDVRDRFLNVVIENLSFDRLLDNLDSETVLFYMDPPYYHGSRRMTNNYKFEMTDKDHELLIEKIKSLKAKVILSGYQSDLYDTLLEHNFIRREIETTNFTAASQLGKDSKSIECLYLSPHFRDFEKRRNLFFKT